ncbi:hypothetical protein ANO14919_037460 [Xylariales sp. No.14919]|nr:hypothetical protein ANO14919_037460 [Xylariales sp. No.14919]
MDSACGLRGHQEPSGDEKLYLHQSRPQEQEGIFPNVFGFHRGTRITVVDHKVRR